MPSFRQLFDRLEAWLIENEDTSLTVFLAVLCFLSFIVLPFVHMTGLTGLWVSSAYSVLFIVGALTGGLRGFWRTLVFSLAILSTASTWLRDGSAGGTAAVISLVSSILLMGLVSFQLNLEVFRPGEINRHRLRGAVAVYLLIGFIFAMAYGLVELLIPGSFYGLGPEGWGPGLEHAFYFSFVTLTTLGFGDISPLGRVAQNLVVIEAILGQLYLAILIGRLVSLHDPQA